LEESLILRFVAETSLVKEAIWEGSFAFSLLFLSDKDKSAK